MLRKLLFMALATLCNYASAPQYDRNAHNNRENHYNQNAPKFATTKRKRQSHTYPYQGGAKYRKLDGIFHQRRGVRL